MKMSTAPKRREDQLFQMLLQKIKKKGSVQILDLKEGKGQCVCVCPTKPTVHVQKHQSNLIKTYMSIHTSPWPPVTEKS